MADKINKEMAEQEFSNFADDMDLDVDISNMDSEDKEAFEKLKRKIILAIINGSLIFNENSEPVFTPQRSGDNTKPITFKEVTGAGFLSMDKTKQSHGMAKVFGLMAEMTGTSQKTFSNFVGSDIKVCIAITNLFLD